MSAKKTYAQARVAILDYLKSQDWDLSLPSLKVPYATSPDRTIRLWFKPQAVYFTESDSGMHRFSDARTLAYDFDYRAISPADFLKFVVSSIKGSSASRPSTNPGSRTTKVRPVMNGREKRLIKAQIRSLRREVIPKLRQRIKDLRRARAKRIRACQAECRAARRRLISDAQKARERLRAYILKAREKARHTCKACKVTADERGLDTLEALLKDLEVNRQMIAELRRKAAAIPISEKRRKAGIRAAETRAESDDEVRRNLGDDRELVALWQQVKHKIKKGPRRSRTEAFFEYVEEHPEALDELRARKEREYEREAERLFEERATCKACESDDPGVLSRSLKEWKQAQEFVNGDVPF